MEPEQGCGYAEYTIRERRRRSRKDKEVKKRRYI